MKMYKSFTETIEWYEYPKHKPFEFMAGDRVLLMLVDTIDKNRHFVSSSTYKNIEYDWPCPQYEVRGIASMPSGVGRWADDTL